MRTSPASVRDGGGHGSVAAALRLYEERWRNGRSAPPLTQFLAEQGPDAISPRVLTALVKADLARRFKQGDRPTAAEYLRCFPHLGTNSDRVLSIVYEEFCLCEEYGECPIPDEFCERYAEWTDSLASQLFYHHDLSYLAGLPVPPTAYPLSGQRFAGFDLLDELGRGGDARVFRAREVSLGNRSVVVKVSSDRGSEPAILANLDHPHIVAVYSVVHQPENRLRGLCMPYHPGVPLDDVIESLDLGRRAARTARDLIAALERGPNRTKSSAEPPTAADTPRAVAPDPRADEKTIVDSTNLTEREKTVIDGAGWAGFPINGTYPDAVAWVGSVLARTLGYAHANQVEHRDVKPANVLLTYQLGPQLLDFNLAHSQCDAEQATAALRGGTLPYMAPEQLQAFLDPARWSAVDARADLYSLGLVLREMLSGCLPDLPEPGLTLTRAINALLDRRSELVSVPRRVRIRDRVDQPLLGPAARANGRPRIIVEPAEDNPDATPVHVPPSLESIIAHCLRPNPDERYQTAAELAEDLDLFLQRRPLRHAANPSWGELLRNWFVRHALPLAVIAALTITCGVIFATNYERWTRPPEERSAFLTAVDELDHNQPATALRLLKPLAEEAPDSPLIQIHQAAAWAKLNRGPETEDALERAWKRPDAAATLRSWGIAHPNLAVLTFDTVNAVLHFESAQQRVNAIPAEKLPTILQSLQLVTTMNPRLEKAQLQLAAVSELAGDFERAQAILTELIDGTRDSGAAPAARAARLAPFHLSRARLRTKWGAALLDRAGQGEPLLGPATLLLNGATDDLDRHEAYRPTQPGRNACDVNYVRCENQLAQGRLLEWKEARGKAAQCYAEARKLCDAVAVCYAGNNRFERLRQDIQTRLAALTPSDPGTR